MTKVYPIKASALNCHHPIAGAPRIEGVDWPYDTFTCRRLTDGSFTEDPAKAYKPAPAAQSAMPSAFRDDDAKAGGQKPPPAKND